MKSIYNETYENLERFLIEHNEKKFRAVQIFEWLYKKRVTSFEEMTNMSSKSIELLKEYYHIRNLEIVNRQVDEGVVKFLFNLEDNNKVEAVLMYHDYGNSLCISTQVGCNMGCTFCESGRLKKVRNLEVNEMVLQILNVEANLDIRISHVVLMGIGEPLDNYDNVVDFINIITSNKGIDLGVRHITVSTCGVIPKIISFMNDLKQVNLAISLHAPNNDIRNKLMPINKAYPIEKLMIVLKEYINVTNRRLTFEYIMLEDINDSKDNALELAKLLKGLNCYVNLIPYNETSHIIYKKSSKNKILEFYDTLKKQNINVTIRKEFGSKVMAACGQLRSNYVEENK